MPVSAISGSAPRIATNPAPPPPQAEKASASEGPRQPNALNSSTPKFQSKPEASEGPTEIQKQHAKDSFDASRTQPSSGANGGPGAHQQQFSPPPSVPETPKVASI